MGAAGGDGEAGPGHRVLGDHRGQHAGALPADPGLPLHTGLCQPPGVHRVIAVVSRYTLCRGGGSARSCLQLVGAFDYYYSKQLHTIPRVIGAETLFSKLSNNIGLKLSALMLCGVQARLVGQLTRTLSFGQLLVHTFSLYLFTFFVSHIMIVTVIDKVI